MSSKRVWLCGAIATAGLLSAGSVFWLRTLRMALPIVAVIPETTAEELWESEHAGVTAVSKGKHWRVYWNAPDDPQDASQQIALLKHAEEMGAAGVILTPDDPLALNTELSRIVRHGVPTVVISTGITLEPSDKLRFVLNDDEVSANLAADYLGDLLHDHGKVALIGNDPENTSASSRCALFAQALGARHSGIRIVAQPHGTLNFGEAEQQIEEILRDNDDLDAIISVGIIETRTAVSVLRALNRREMVALIGFDQDLDLMYELRHGGIKAIVAQDTNQMGALAMNMITDPALMARQPSVVRIAPVLITASNIDTPESQRILSMDWRH